MKPKKKITCLLAIIVMGYAAFGVYSFVMQKVLMYPYPYGSFLFNRMDQFMDFFNINYMVHERRPYIDYYSSYPPLALVLAWPFSLIADYASYEYPPVAITSTLPAKLSIGIFLGVFTVLMGIVLYLFLKRGDVIKNTLLRCIVVVGLIGTAPYIFMVDRGNYLIVTIVLMLAFAYFYEKNEWVAAVFLGLAVAMKIYPAYLFLLLIIDKRWKGLCISTAVAGGLSLISLLFFCGGVWQNIKSFGSALLSFGSGYSEEYPNVYFCTGLTSLLRMPFVIWNEGMVPKQVPLMFIYIVLGSGLSLWSVWTLRKERQLWKKLLILICLMVFLTPNSYMYNLMYLLPAIVLFLLAKGSSKKWLDWCYIVLIGLLLIPKAYYYIVPAYLIGIQTIIDGCLLLVVILFYNIVDKEKNKC